MITLGKQHFKVLCPDCGTTCELIQIEVDYQDCGYVLDMDCIKCGKQVVYPLGLDHFIILNEYLLGGKNEEEE